MTKAHTVSQKAADLFDHAQTKAGRQSYTSMILVHCGSATLIQHAVCEHVHLANNTTPTDTPELVEMFYHTSLVTGLRYFPTDCKQMSCHSCISLVHAAMTTWVGMVHKPVMLLTPYLMVWVTHTWSLVSSGGHGYSDTCHYWVTSHSSLCGHWNQATLSAQSL